eukprot:95356_1
MAYPNKPTERKKTTTPSWAERSKIQPRRRTTTDTTPALPTGSRRHIRHIPSKPRGGAKASDLYAKKKNRARPNTKPTQSHDPPPAQTTPQQKPVRAPPKPHHPPVPPQQSSRSSIGTRNRSSVDVTNDDGPQPVLQKSETCDTAQRWSMHPHAPYGNNLISMRYSNDDDVKSTKTKKKPMHKAEPKRAPPDVDGAANTARNYSKNIAG